MKGRKPIPTALKLLSGNPGRRPLNYKEPVFKSADATPPEEISDERCESARREWNRVAPYLIEAGVMKAVDRTALLAYCLAYQRWSDSEIYLREHGVFTRTKSGYLIQNPYLSVAAKALEQMRSLMVDFGLTPSSRVRLKAEFPAKEFDPMEEFLSRGRKQRS